MASIAAEKGEMSDRVLSRVMSPPSRRFDYSLLITTEEPEPGLSQVTDRLLSVTSKPETPSGDYCSFHLRLSDIVREPCPNRWKCSDSDYFFNVSELQTVTPTVFFFFNCLLSY